jgi:hypothetical protein
LKLNVRWDISAIILLVIAALVMGRLWFMPLGNSFWLDETIIAFLIRNNFQETIYKTFIVTHPVLFTAIAWLMRHLSDSEIALRLPSVLASVGSLYVLYRLGREAIDRETGVIFACIHLTLMPVAVQAVNARPYALALFFQYVSILWLLRWTRSGKVRHGLLWITAAVLATYFHHLFVMALGTEFLFALVVTLQRSVLRFRDLAWYGIVAGLGLIPAVPQAVMIARQSRLFAWVPTPSWTDLLIAFLPVSVLVGVCLIAGFACLNKDWPTWKRPAYASLTLLGALLLAPILVLFITARFSSVNLFTGRYLLSTTPGCVLLFGWVLRGLEPILVRRMSLACALLVIGMTAGNVDGFTAPPDYSQELWRQAVKEAPLSGGMLVYSGHVETRRLDWLQDPERWEFMICPVLVYRPGLSPRDAFVIPFEFGSEQQNYIEGVLDGPLRHHNTLTVITRILSNSSVWPSWLQKRLAIAGYSKLRSTGYGNIQVDVYKRER